MGRNTADFHGITFSHKDTQGTDGITVTANHPKKGIIGKLYLGNETKNGTRKIRNIYIRPEFRRQGIATGLYNYAVANELKPRHSADRTDEGDAWAKSLGGWIPERGVKSLRYRKYTHVYNRDTDLNI